MMKSTLITTKTGFVSFSKARTRGQSHTVKRQAQAGKLVKIRPDLHRLARFETTLY